MKWSVFVCLATPDCHLDRQRHCGGSVPSAADSLNNGGAHGFSELLYAYSSCGGNNGSAFAGFNANTVFLNISLGLVMLFARFLPIIGTLAIARKPCRKEKNCNHSRNPFYYKCNVCILADFYCFACWCAQLFPGVGVGANCRIFPKYSVKEVANMATNQQKVLLPIKRCSAER